LGAPSAREGGGLEGRDAGRGVLEIVVGGHFAAFLAEEGFVGVGGGRWRDAQTGVLGVGADWRTESMPMVGIILSIQALAPGLVSRRFGVGLSGR
jgi:hypothetical protein